MRALFMTILLVAICLTGYQYFIASDANGIWGDAKTVKGLKDTEVGNTSIPTN